MDVKTIEMDRDEARERFLEYRREIHGRRDAEDVELTKAFKALSEGVPLISMSQALADAGLNEHGQPRIAISRCDQPWSWFSRGWDTGSVAFGPTSDLRWDRRRANVGPYPDFMRFKGCYTPEAEAWPWADSRSDFRCRALVPAIPPSFRPEKLHLHHILFEPSWEEMPPDPDPMLLKRISSDLFAVLAVWDLTEVELQVLKRRFDA